MAIQANGIALREGAQDVVFVTTRATALASFAAAAAGSRRPGVAAPTLEALAAITARLAACKGLYSPQ
jgi:hypothetical protein